MLTIMYRARAPAVGLPPQSGSLRQAYRKDTVLSAATAEAVIRVEHDFAGNIDLLLTCFSMAGSSGAELTQEDSGVGVASTPIAGDADVQLPCCPNARTQPRLVLCGKAILTLGSSRQDRERPQSRCWRCRCSELRPFTTDRDARPSLSRRRLPPDIRPYRKSDSSPLGRQPFGARRSEEHTSE